MKLSDRMSGGIKKMQIGRVVSAVIGVAGCVIAAGAAGCATEQAATRLAITEQVRRPEKITYRRGEDSIQRELIGHSVKGRPIEAVILGEGPQTILFMGAIHGNEPAGAGLLREFEGYLRSNRYLLYGNRVVIVPVANPDGLAANTRYNANGVDLNRDFGGPGWDGSSEPECVALKKVIRRFRPERIVSIHQPLSCVDYDGPGLGLAYRMAGCCGLGVQKLGARPGSLGSYAGVALNVPVVTVELGGADHHLGPRELWRRYGRMLVAAVVYSGDTDSGWAK